MAAYLKPDEYLPRDAVKNFDRFGGKALGSTDETPHETFHTAAKHADKAYKQSNPKKPAEHADKPTVGTQEYNNSSDPAKFIKKFDPNNLSGAIPFGLDIAKKMKDLSGENKILSDIVGSGLAKLMSSVTDLMKMKEILSDPASLLPAELAALSQSAQNLANTISSGFSEANNVVGGLTGTPIPTQALPLSSSLTDKIQAVSTNLGSATPNTSPEVATALKTNMLTAVGDVASLQQEIDNSLGKVNGEIMKQFRQSGNR